ncbi:MAG: nuclear transport factor 2 family protein [Candidatus Coatesbacteria bacterium]|nr:MAG: nuclear transport factor 2 family protein [Candidatus Coatesbacteria bacterium]
MVEREEEIRRLARELDEALERGDIEKVVSYFAADCEIEALGVKLNGHGGVRRWLDWLFRYVDEVRFEPVVIMVDGDVFFEEFVVRAKLRGGGEAVSERAEAASKQAEVLVYEDNKVKSLRVYFDRLDFADAVVTNPFEKAIVRKLMDKSTEGLT